MEFKNRVYGIAVVKAVNSNYNADFSGQPRRLPNGKVYATDKAFKYTVKNYLKNVFDKEKVFYFKSLNENLNPISLDESYKKYFGSYPTVAVKDKDKDKGKDKEKVVKTIVASNLLSCIDIRLFGATFAGGTNISLHGPVQVNHGVNIWHEDNVYTEQITSPFSNKANDPDDEKGMTTIGRQAKLEEGHYVHHFSINPQNLFEVANLAGSEAKKLSTEDIEKLKEGMRRGSTWYDSASKAGCENELLFWVQIKESSKIVLPNFTSFIEILREKKNGRVVFDFQKLTSYLNKVSSDIENMEIYYNEDNTDIVNLPQGIIISNL